MIYGNINPFYGISNICRTFASEYRKIYQVMGNIKIIRGVFGTKLRIILLISELTNFAACNRQKSLGSSKNLFAFYRKEQSLIIQADKSEFMEEHNILIIANRREFRAWFEAHHANERECWVEVKRGRPVDDQHFWYLDAVEEALCFGWIDSRHKLIDGKRMQCFTPRKRNSPWTELNKERVRRLERLGLMTDAGRKVLPPMGVRSFKIDKDVETALKSARVWTTFKSFPSLYQRIRAYNVAFYKTRDKGMYEQTLLHFITETKAGRMFGEWNDYGRLLDY